MAALAFAGLAAAGVGQASASERIVLGWLERAILYPGAISVRSRLDSGAQTASLDADIVEIVKRNGEDWVIFDVYAAVTN